MSTYESSFGPPSARKPSFSSTSNSSRLTAATTMSTMSSTSMADSLPPIPFSSATLREVLANFTQKFDTVINTRRSQLLTNRNTFLTNLAENSEDRRQARQEIQIVKLKTEAHLKTVEKEERETDEFEAEISKLRIGVATREDTKASLLAQISQTQSAIDAKFSQQRQHAAKVSKMAVHDIPELDFWQSNLGMRIEGAGQEGRLKFVYTHVDERDWERECWFELVCETRDYAIGACSVRFDAEMNGRVEGVLERLNENRELGGLLKGMREVFVDAVKS